MTKNTTTATNNSLSARTKIALVISAAAVLVFCGFIFYMSAQPAEDSDIMSLGIVYRIISFIVPGYENMPYADQVYWQSNLNHIVRKAAHFTEYAVLGMLVANLLWRIARMKAEQAGEWAERPAAASSTPMEQNHKTRILQVGLWSWVLATAYAATDEIHQMFVPGRAGMITDVLLDSAGVLTGIILVCAVLTIICASRVPRAK